MNLRIIFSTLLYLAFSTLAHAGSDVSWWNDAWKDRFEVAFKAVDYGTEAALVTLKPSYAHRADPYDVRAINDDGTSCPIKVLSFVPAGDATFLIAPDPTRVKKDWRIFLYLD
ncbi:TPA: hypothetical protein DDW35_12165, partial [Candidatus Sumerlaeota bacterium]|nr:hypothetical protein [Candidatus Sumerlaeota bacterium]